MAALLVTDKYLIDSSVKGSSMAEQSMCLRAKKEMSFVVVTRFPVLSPSQVFSLEATRDHTKRSNSILPVDLLEEVGASGEPPACLLSVSTRYMLYILYCILYTTLYTFNLYYT